MQNKPQGTTNPLFIRRSQLKNIVGISPSQVDRLERAGVFPARRRIAGGAAVGWLYDEVKTFLYSQATAI